MATYSVFQGYQNASVVRQIASGGISAKYELSGATPTPDTDSIASPFFTVDFMPLLKGSIVAGSLRFKLGSYTYVDRAGTLYHSVATATGSGTPAGTINYTTGIAHITSWPSGSPTFVLEAGLVNPGSPGMGFVLGRTGASPLQPQSFSISATALDGTSITASAAPNGAVTGALIDGKIDVQNGIYDLRFGELDGEDWLTTLVDPSSLRFNAVSYSYLPLDASVIGLDPVRLPQDGKVPIFREGTFAVVGHTDTEAPLTVSDTQVVDCGRVRLSRVRVIGDDGDVIDTGYTADLEAGTVTFTDVTGYSQPVTVEHRIEDMAQVSDAQINGDLTFTRPITHIYPTGSVVSSALIAGDLKARVSVLFDQATWNGTYSDVLSGSAATGTFNDVIAPIVVTNKGASTERWSVVFTNTTAFNVIGEHVGLIATGNTGSDCSPTNPATSQPYFTLPALGWGGGWSAGNVLRFNTVGALFPIWVVRTIQQGAETVTNDSFGLLIRGDVDHP